VVKLPAAMDLMNIDLTGEKAAACRYCVATFFKRVHTRCYSYHCAVSCSAA
jgi:hypothetical protein